METTQNNKKLENCARCAARRAEQELKSTAYHEAGHYVAFRHLRPEDAESDWGVISIIPDEERGTLGYHAPAEGGPRVRIRAATEADNAEAALLGYPATEFVESSERPDIEAYIVQLFAGAVAEIHRDPGNEDARLRLREPTRDEVEMAENVVPSRVDGSDRDKAEAWLARVEKGRAARAALRRELKRRAKELVAEHWDEIDVVAEALLDRKRLDAEEADLIIRVVNGDEHAERALASYRRFRYQDEAS